MSNISLSHWRISITNNVWQIISHCTGAAYYLFSIIKTQHFSSLLLLNNRNFWTKDRCDPFIVFVISSIIIPVSKRIFTILISKRSSFYAKQLSNVEFCGQLYWIRKPCINIAITSSTLLLCCSCTYWYWYPAYLSSSCHDQLKPWFQHIIIHNFITTQKLKPLHNIRLLLLVMCGTNGVLLFKSMSQN